MKILGLGNALVDVLTLLESDSYVEKAGLKKGAMLLVDQATQAQIADVVAQFESKLATGGSAANTIAGIARLGIESGFIGKVGDDAYGKFFHSDMVESGIKPQLTVSDIPSGCCYALVSPGGERSMGTFLGAAASVGAEDLSLAMFEGYDLVHIEGYLVQNHDLIRRAVALAKEAGVKVSLDMASYNVVEANHDFFTELLQSTDIVFANEEEAHAYTGKEPEEAAACLAEICDIAVVKWGKNGSIIRRGEEVVRVGVIPANCIDTTGAGDLYASGFLYAWAKGLSLEVAGKIGAITSGNVIEVVGPKMDNDRWQLIKAQIAEVCC